MRSIVLFLCLMLLWPVLAMAKETELSDEFSICVDRANGVTSENLGCISEENVKHDARLNQAYNGLMSVLSERRKKELREAQRAWIKYRETTTDYLRNPDGGTLDLVIATNWFLHCTVERADFLEGELALATGNY
ncbi:lysozyme inhibitor LprI family protein [Deltaproteobacteria bacterium OttesenSCG-928-M10]|nr:lysozyme inhibitor LprI family protein [Deltaproteobacteria bacterium OttesenSCG-928-M10]